MGGRKNNQGKREIRKREKVRSNSYCAGFFPPFRFPTNTNIVVRNLLKRA